MPISEIESPFQPNQQPHFDYVHYAHLPISSEQLAVRQRMHQLVVQFFQKEMPADLGKAATDLLLKYASGYGDFFVLFYTYIWSFLYWIPKQLNFKAPDALLRGHGLTLFLHLLDDHLKDGQLPSKMLTLQMRTLTWQQIKEDASSAQRFFKTEVEFDKKMDTYLVALHQQATHPNLETYLSVFPAEISIWTIFPSLINGSDFNSIALCTSIENFALSWRLIDDLADIEEDLPQNNPSAVWHALDDFGKAHWVAFPTSKNKNQHLSELINIIKSQFIVERLLQKATVYLENAHLILPADSIGLKQEIQRMSQFLRKGRH